MRVVLLCATRRGRLFLEALARLLPEASLIVVSFPEEPWEPPFLEEIRRVAETVGGQFVEARQVGLPRLRALWEAEPIDLLFAVSWRYFVPPSVYRLARQGAFLFHDSLLPRNRGFSPTPWAIINGEESTGVSLIEMTEEIDAGDVIDQETVQIGPDDTITVVLESVTNTYLRILERNLATLVENRAVRRPQDPALATYCCKRLPEDNRIDWSWATTRVWNLVRAVTRPYPGAYTQLGDRKLTVWGARQDPTGERYVGRVPGRVIRVVPGVGAIVLTGDGSLLLSEVQLEGEPAVEADRVLSSIHLTLR